MTEEKFEFAYQKLFGYLHSEHNCTLLESDLQQIYNIVNDDLQEQLLAEQAKNAELNGELVNKNQQLFKEQAKNKKLVEFIRDNYYKCVGCCGDKETAEVYCEGKCGHWCSHYEVRQALNEVNK